MPRKLKVVNLEPKQEENNDIAVVNEVVVEDVKEEIKTAESQEPMQISLGCKAPPIARRTARMACWRRTKSRGTETRRKCEYSAPRAVRPCWPTAPLQTPHTRSILDRSFEYLGLGVV